MKQSDMKNHKTAGKKHAISEIVKIADKSYIKVNSSSSRKKAYACVLMALHPHALTLGEIAEMADVPIGTLKVWRTEKKFQEAMKQVYTSISNKLIREIANSFDNPRKETRHLHDFYTATIPDTIKNIAAMLPFLHPCICEKVIWELVRKIDQGDTRYVSIIDFIHKQKRSSDDEIRRQFESRPEILSAAKAAMLLKLDILFQLLVEKISDKNTIDLGKQILFSVEGDLVNKLDILSGGGDRHLRSQLLLERGQLYREGY